MTDRELLELVAKAAGYECPDFNSVNGSAFWVPMYGFWNPLTDDGDALRLVVKLRFGVEVHEEIVVVGDGNIVLHEQLGDDPYAATRRAIVRAAAEIGRGM